MQEKKVNKIKEKLSEHSEQFVGDLIVENWTAPEYDIPAFNRIEMMNMLSPVDNPAVGETDWNGSGLPDRDMDEFEDDGAYADDPEDDFDDYEYMGEELETEEQLHEALKQELEKAVKTKDAFEIEFEDGDTFDIDNELASALLKQSASEITKAGKNKHEFMKFIHKVHS